MTVEVVATLPLAAQVENVTRALGLRHTASKGRNKYPPTILELIRLVEPNPRKPRFRSWNRVSTVTVGFDDKLKEVTVEYCVEKCTLDKRTGAPHPKRKMIAYSAPEDQVAARINKRLAELEQ